MRSTALTPAGTAPSPAELVDAVKQLGAEDIGVFPDGALLDRIRQLQRLRCAVDAAMASTIEVTHLRGAGGYDGSPSTKAWLRGRLRMSPREARTIVESAAALRDLPAFTAEYAEGKIASDHVAVMAELRRKAGPEVARIADPLLIPYALTSDARELRRIAKLVMERIAQNDDDDGDKNGGRPPEPDRFLRLAPTLGAWNLEGALTPEAGAMLQTALDAAMKKPAPDDDRTPLQRRHDAFADIIQRALDSASLPTHGGENVHLGVLVNVDTFRSRGNRRSKAPQGDLPPQLLEEIAAYFAAHDSHDTQEPGSPQEPADEPGPACGEESGSGSAGAPTDPPPGQTQLRQVLPKLDAPRRRLPGPGDGGLTDWGQRLSPAAVRRLACDAAIYRIVLGPRDLPLSAGQRTRLIPPALRRVLIARDGGCRFPGCDRPPAWTQAHHVVYWSDGGPTSLDNLVLLCSFHHHRVHDHGWKLSFDGATVIVHRPDGTQLRPPGCEELAAAGGSVTADQRVG